MSPSRSRAPPGFRASGTRPSLTIPPRSKVKGAGSIKIAALPDIVSFEAWKIQVRKQVMAASGRRGEAFHWTVDVNP